MESAGYAPLLFASAEEVLRSPAIVEAACLIADVRMPGMDGIELQRQIRLTRPELPIILITAHQDDDVRRRALAAGAFDFMYKPFDPADLLTVIHRALSESSND